MLFGYVKIEEQRTGLWLLIVRTIKRYKMIIKDDYSNILRMLSVKEMKFKVFNMYYVDKS